MAQPTDLESIFADDDKNARHPNGSTYDKTMTDIQDSKSNIEGFGDNGYNSQGYNREGLGKDQPFSNYTEYVNDQYAKTGQIPSKAAFQGEIENNRKDAEKKATEDRRSSFDKMVEETERRAEQGRMEKRQVEVLGGLSTALGGTLGTIPVMMKMARGVLTGDAMSMSDAVIGSVFNELDMLKDQIYKPGGLEWGIKEGADLEKLRQTPWGNEYINASQASSRGVLESLQKLESIYKDLNDNGPDGSGPTGGAGVWDARDMDSDMLQAYYDRVAEQVDNVNRGLETAKGDDRFALLAEKQSYVQVLNGIQERAKDIDTSYRREVRDIQKYRNTLRRLSAESNKRFAEANRQYSDATKDYYMNHTSPVIASIAASMNINRAEDIFLNAYTDDNGRITLEPARIPKQDWPKIDNALNAYINTHPATDPTVAVVADTLNRFNRRRSLLSNQKENIKALNNARMSTRLLGEMEKDKNGLPNIGLTQLEYIPVDQYGYPSDPRKRKEYVDYLENLQNTDITKARDMDVGYILEHIKRADWIDDAKSKIDMNAQENKDAMDILEGRMNLPDYNVGGIASYIAMADLVKLNRGKIKLDRSMAPDIYSFQNAPVVSYANKMNNNLVKNIPADLKDHVKAAFDEIDQIAGISNDVRNALKVQWMEDPSNKDPLGRLTKYIDGKYNVPSLDIKPYALSDTGEAVLDLMSNYGRFDDINKAVTMTVETLSDVRSKGNNTTLTVEEILFNNPTTMALRTGFAGFNSQNIGKLNRARKYITDFLLQTDPSLLSTTPITASLSAVKKKAIYLPFNRAAALARKYNESYDTSSSPPRHLGIYHEGPDSVAWPGRKIEDRMTEPGKEWVKPSTTGQSITPKKLRELDEAFEEFCRIAKLDPSYMESFDAFLNITPKRMEELVKDVNVSKRLLDARDMSKVFPGYWRGEKASRTKRYARTPEVSADVPRETGPGIDEGLPSVPDPRRPENLQHLFTQGENKPINPLMSLPESDTPRERQTVYPSGMRHQTQAKEVPLSEDWRNDPYGEFNRLISTKDALDINLTMLAEPYNDLKHTELRRRFGEGLEAQARENGMTPDEFMGMRLKDVVERMMEDIRNTASKTYVKRVGDQMTPAFTNENAYTAYTAWLADEILGTGFRDGVTAGDIIEKMDGIVNSRHSNKMYNKAFRLYRDAANDSRVLISEYCNLRDMIKVYNQYARDHNNKLEAENLLTPEEFREMKVLESRESKSRRYRRKDKERLGELRERLSAAGEGQSRIAPISEKARVVTREPKEYDIGKKGRTSRLSDVMKEVEPTGQGADKKKKGAKKTGVPKVGKAAPETPNKKLSEMSSKERYKAYTTTHPPVTEKEKRDFEKLFRKFNSKKIKDAQDMQASQDQSENEMKFEENKAASKNRRSETGERINPVRPKKQTDKPEDAEGPENP